MLFQKVDGLMHSERVVRIFYIATGAATPKIDRNSGLD